MCDLKDLISDCNKAAGAVGKLASANEKLEKSFRGLVSPIRSVTSEFEKLTREVGDLERRLKAVSGLIDPLRQDMSKLNGELQGGAGRFQNLTKEMQAYANAAQEAEKRVGALNAKQAESGKASGPPGGGAGKSASPDRSAGDKVGKLGGALSSAFLGAATGETQSLIEGLSGVVDVFASASAEGVGFKGILLGIGEAIAPLLLPLAGVAAAAAALAAPFALGAAEINKANGDIIGGLGLTEEELSRVTHKTVTMGDVFQATLNVIGRHIMEGPVGSALTWLGSAAHEGFTNFVMSIVDRVADLVGFWVAAFDTIVKNWRNLPTALGAVFVGAVNLAIRQIERLINGGLGALNVFITAANKIPGVKLELHKPIDIPEMKMAGGEAAQAVYSGFEKKQTEVRANLKRVVGSVWKEVSAEAVGLVKKDALKQAKAGSVTNNTTNNTNTRGGSVFNADREAEVVAPNVREVETVGVVEQLKAVTPEIPVKISMAPFVKLTPELDALIEKFEAIGKVATGMSAQLEAAFGKPGKALATLVTSVADYDGKMAEIQRQEEKREITTEVADQKRVETKIKAYGTIVGAAKGFFKENSDGYKAMEVAEIAFHTLETLNTIKSMALRGADTASAVAAEAPKQAAYGATAYAKTLSSLPFPFNLLAGATVLAALVQVGAAIKGKPSGGAAPGATDMKTRQDAQGTGSSLGDSKAKSDSLEKALGYAEGYQNKDLEYGNAMVRSLRSIDDQIGAVASALAKSFGAGGMLSTEGLSLGKTGSAATLSNLGFGKTTTRTLQDQGIQFDAASLGAILGGGLSGSTYQQVLENTKKKAFGITTSNKSKVITETGSLDTDFLDQVGKLIGSLGKGVADAAKALGQTDVEALLAKFQVNLGKLSFKDMTGTQIEEALNAIFGKLGDDMAKAAVPAIAQFQKVGEGAFETLARVARQYEVIDTTLKSVGMTFGSVGVSSLAARERLVELAGGLDNLTDQTAFFGEHFLTEEERLKPVRDSVSKELTRLKLPADLTRQGFKEKVLGQDVSTKDGAELYAALMALAPAFDKVATAAEAAKAAVDEKGKSIQDRIDDLVMTPAQKLAKSRTAEEDAVKALDASLLPLLKSLWAVEDAAKNAADAAEKEAVAKAQSSALADLLDAQGYTEQAKKIRRDLSLADVKDPLQQDYMRRTWAAQDAAEKVSAARDMLTQAYQREQEAIQATKDKFKELSNSLRAFSASLSDTIAGTDPGTRYRRTRDTFMATAAMARLGDPDAMGRLQSEGEAFTAASRDYVSTSLDYLRDVGLVRSAVDEAADTADRQVSIAQRQLDALDASVQGLIEIKASVVSVEQAILSLRGALGEARAAGVISVGGSNLGLADPVPNPAGGNTGGNAYDPHKTLDGKYYYDQMLGMLAYTESLRDPQYYEGGVNPALQPGTDAYAILETFKVRNKDQYDYQERMRLLQSYATGGSFEVGGSGPPDSKFFGLALSPGEAVNVQRADQKGDRALINELRNLRAELADLRASSARIANSNDKMERTLTNVTEGGRAMQTQAAA